METVAKGLASFVVIMTVNFLPPSPAKSCIYWGLMLLFGLRGCWHSRLLTWPKGTGRWVLGGAVTGAVLSAAATLALRPQGLPPAVLEAVLVAPFAEEVYYRGYLVQALESKLEPTWAVTAATILFAFSHGSAPAVGLALVIGSICMYLARQSGSLLPAFALHAMFNLCQVLH